MQRGTTAEELLAHLGEPTAREPLTEYSIDAEIWRYERTVAVDSELVIMDTRTAFYWDFSLQKLIEYDEPVYEQQNNSIIEQTELLLVASQVVKWRRSHEEDAEVTGISR